MDTAPWLAVDIGGTMIKYARFDRAGNILGHGEIPTLAQEGAHALMARITALCRAQLPLGGIGICTAGQVDADEGRIVFATNALPGWQGMPVKERLQGALSVPVVVENDGNAAALGEAKLGSARGERHMLCLTYGTGIGGGLFLDNRLYRGSGWSAGECGHTVIMAGGRPCTCGARGCYEAYASASALLRDVRAEIDRDMDLPAFFDAMRAGGAAERSLYGRWLEYLVAGLAGLVHTLNPRCLVLGGAIMHRQPIAQEVAALLPRRVMHSFSGVQVRASSLGNLAGLYGMYYRIGEEVGGIDSR